MTEQKPILANPLSPLGHEAATLFSPGAFSAVCARPGVGKTAFLVQMALWALSMEKNVLHVSLRDPIKKVDLWYQDLFRALTGRMGLPDASGIWAAFLPRRFIMTFKVEGFSVPKLEERMTDLMEQKIFIPNVLLLDGLISDTFLSADIQALKDSARRQALPVWFSVQTQQYPHDGEPSPVPPAFQSMLDTFESIISLEGTADRIRVRNVKGGSERKDPLSLQLDPSTLLLTLENTP